MANIPHYWYDADGEFNFIIVDVRDENGTTVTQAATFGLGFGPIQHTRAQIEHIVTTVAQLLAPDVQLQPARQISGGTLH